MAKSKDKNKRNFSSFNLNDAMKFLGIKKLHEWSIHPAPRTPSDFFYERLKRLQRSFDTKRTERAKEMVVEVYCEEALGEYLQLKFWKAAPLTSDQLTGVVDYLLALQADYVDTPLLLVMEAKKDDFEQGLAQSLVEMYACRENNTKAGIDRILYAIVTNGSGWQFYRYEQGEVYESRLFSNSDDSVLLGVLSYIFSLCAQ